jgi:hypothetical protein
MGSARYDRKILTKGSIDMYTTMMKADVNHVTNQSGGAKSDQIAIVRS